MHEHATPAQLAAELQRTGDFEAEYCSDDMLARYLRARGHCLEKSAAMLRETIKWRREHSVGSLAAAEFEGSPYMREGWLYVAGNDAAGRAIVMLRKRKDKIPLADAPAYIRFFTFTLESAVRAMRGSAEQWVFVLDMKEYSPANAPHPGVTLQVLQVLANHYPERLHKAYFVDAPGIFSVFFKMMSPFVDPVTRSKVEFVQSRDYLPHAKASATGSSSWGSWASSMLGTSSWSKAPPPAGGSGEPAADADVVIEQPAGPPGGTFGPLLAIHQKPDRKSVV